MARVVTVGPLRLWAKHGSGGDILVVEHAGQRAEHPRSSRSARAVTAWAAYRDKDHVAAASYKYLPMN